MSNFETLDAIGTAEAIRAKKLSAEEAVDMAIANIEKVEPELNATTTKLFDSARALAKSGTLSGSFAGVPYAIKDILAAVEGVPMRSGSKWMEDFVPPRDSILVSRLRKAGFVFVAKTTTPEFGFLPTTEPLAYGPTKNPHDPSRTTGGSSGGSAALVGARALPAAHANDGGGSIRIPAACCGLFGMKPTRGRITLGPDLGDIMSGLVAEHAVTLTVRDSAAILDATAGPALGDPYYAPPPERPYLEECKRDPGRLKIAVTTKSITETKVDPECVRAVESTAKLLEELGHEVVEADMPGSGDLLTQAFMVLWTSGAAATLDFMTMLRGGPPGPGDIEPLSRALGEAGRLHSASTYLQSIAMLQQISRVIAGFMESFDVVVTPTLAEPPVPLGSFKQEPDNPMAALFRSAEFAPFTPVQNVTGQPAMSMPLHFTESGLPIGVHFIGRYADEATLFRLAGQLEKARPWLGRKPKVCA